MAKLGVGSDVDTSDAAAHYIVDVRGSATGVATDGRRKLVAEVRDRYNNPVPGVTVNVTGVPASRLSATTVTTDVDGRAAVTYTAPDATTAETVTMEFDGGTTDRQRATFDLYVGGGGGGGGSGGLAWTTAADWDARSDERGVVHESQTDTDWPGGGAIELGYQSDDESGDSLVSYWPLDEDSGTTGSTVTDVAGPHDGTLVGANGGDDGVFGRTAYDFARPNDEYVDLGDVDAGDDTDRLTISAWFNAESFSDHDPRIVSKAHGESAGDHIWMMSEDGNELRVRLRTDGSTQTHYGPSISTGTWTHGVMTYDGSQVCVYVDAGTPDCFAQSGSIPASDDPTYLGASTGDSGGVDRFWDGQIDEVRIYDRALSESEVQTLHDASTSGYLVTDWRNESSAMDVSAMELSSVGASVPSGTSVTVYVQSDTDGDGSVDETSNAITVDGSTGSYAVEGLSTDTDTFRLRVELASSGPTESPTFSGAELSST
ncbi:LamG-like jellyroll fold domain-containing protein [Salinigranum rubrum]|nr:LamG-like jellyroll fold domain-containing protein [Salinigranum rubrum]